MLRRVHVRRVRGVGNGMRVRREGVLVRVRRRGGRVRKAVRAHRGTHLVRLVRRRVPGHGRDRGEARRLREAGERRRAVRADRLRRNGQLSCAVLHRVGPSDACPALRTLWLTRVARLLMRVARLCHTPIRRALSLLLLLPALLLATVSHLCEPLLRPRRLEKVVGSRG